MVLYGSSFLIKIPLFAAQEMYQEGAEIYFRRVPQTPYPILE
jgi:hypothetical protein